MAQKNININTLFLTVNYKANM